MLLITKNLWYLSGLYIWVYQGCFWHCIWHDKCRLSRQAFDFYWGYMFKFIKAVSDTVFDMIKCCLSLSWQAFDISSRLGFRRSSSPISWQCMKTVFGTLFDMMKFCLSWQAFDIFLESTFPFCAELQIHKLIRTTEINRGMRCWRKTKILSHGWQYLELIMVCYSYI